MHTRRMLHLPMRSEQYEERRELYICNNSKCISISMLNLLLQAYKDVSFISLSSAAVLPSFKFNDGGGVW